MKNVWNYLKNSILVIAVLIAFFVYGIAKVMLNSAYADESSVNGECICTVNCTEHGENQECEVCSRDISLCNIPLGEGREDVSGNDADILGTESGGSAPVGDLEDGDIPNIEGLVCICLEKCHKPVAKETITDESSIDEEDESLHDGEEETDAETGIDAETGTGSETDTGDETETGSGTDTGDETENGAGTGSGDEVETDALPNLDEATAENECPLCRINYRLCQYEANLEALYPTVATVSIYKIDDDEDSDTYGTIIESLAKFPGLNNVAVRISELTNEVRSLGSEYEEFKPVIKLCSDINQEYNVSFSGIDELTLDLNGYDIILADDSSIAFYDVRACIEDSAYIPFSVDGDNYLKGCICGSNDSLLYTDSKLEIRNGCFINNEGLIVSGITSNESDTSFDNEEISDGNESDEETESEQAKVVVLSGFFYSEAPYIFAENVRPVICDGFFKFNPYDSDVVTVSANSGQIFSDGLILRNKDITINDEIISGYVFGIPLYAFVLGNECQEDDAYEEVMLPSYYFLDFDTCFLKAIEYSRLNGGQKASVKILDEDIVSIVLDHTLIMSRAYRDDWEEPVVEFNNIDFKKESEYGGSLFLVDEGTLILNDCTVDAGREDNKISFASAVIVGDGAALSLCGSLEKGVTIKDNTSIVVADDPGAGIWLGKGSTLILSGNVTVNNNYNFHATTDFNKECTIPCNIVFSNDTEELSSIIIDAPLSYGEDDNASSYKIGITTTESLDENNAVVGKLSDEYYEAILTDYFDAQYIDIKDQTEAFFMDVSASHHIFYDGENNVLSWNYKTAFLPDAGISRIEYVLLLFGLISLVLRNLRTVKARAGLHRYMTVMFVIFITLGTGMSIYKLSSERAIAKKNYEVLNYFSEKRDYYDSDLDAASSGSDSLSLSLYENDATNTEGENAIDDQNTRSEKTLILPEDGREYCGVIEVESLGIRLPVIAKYTDADMKISPCVYYGDASSDNLVIVGHNYDSQFGKLNEIDDEVHATLYLADGSVISYKSILVEALEMTDVEKMISGKWDMTLFTCSYSKVKRVAIRFIRE